ncbi:hypothetical protein KUTeg_006473 [Tegillarca granosa]|uniref:Ig-like domain-containing protein n=1 Tax=Tegillarca granosa TaxID=220873 RepID=A0ABQ9FGP0_TEGGR|nr:hypothetical protein KUTeg_006473 [Tegillarca granosa]
MRQSNVNSANNGHLQMILKKSIIIFTEQNLYFFKHETKKDPTNSHPCITFIFITYILPDNCLVVDAPTEAPNITGYKSFQGIREGEDITLTCTVLGGYPQPTLTWICSNMLMDAKNKSTEGVEEVVLPLIIKRTLHGQQCICNGTSIANYSRASNVFLIVHYPPSATLISAKKQLSSGINYNLFCQVEEGNPTVYYISWSQIFANTVVRNNADLNHLLSNNRHNLTLTEISYKDIGLYTCSVHNYITDLNGNLLQNKSVPIQRNFSAVFASSNVFQYVSGRSFDVKIPFYCQPKVMNINDLMWLRKENYKQQKVSNSGLSFSLLTAIIRIPFYRTSVMVDGQVAIMTIKVSSYALDGNYVLRVRNIEGVYESFEFEIKVKGKEQQTSLSVIVGCSVGVVIFVAAVVVVVIYVVLRRKTSQGKDRKEKK